MKVLHINSYYGSSKFYKNLYKNQIKNGLDIQVFVPTPVSFDINEFDYGEYTTVSKNHSKYDRFIFHIKHQKIYKDIQEKYNIKDFSIIHAHSLFSNGYIAMRLKKEYGIPYIVAVRNTDVNLFFKRMIHLRKIGLEILREAGQIIFLSKPYKELVIEKYIPQNLRETINSKVSIIPNGIDEFWFNNAGSPRQKLYNKLQLLQIGDIDKNKNIITTISAIEILLEKGCEIKLNVVGKIKDQKIFDKIKELEYVNYLGYVSKEELIKIYRKNDIFILPSIHETFGLVYAEAMSQGLPVIYSKGQGFDGQFEDGTVGYVVDSLDPNDIAEKIIKIFYDYEIKSKNCIELFHKFDWKTIACEYLSLYENLDNKGDSFIKLRVQ